MEVFSVLYFFVMLKKINLCMVIFLFIGFFYFFVLCCFEFIGKIIFIYF